MFSTADGRRRLPDDVSGKKATNFQFIFFAQHLLPAWVCVCLR
jgi:hypothetical protein